MAEYDGAVRVKINVDSRESSAQLMMLENRITKTAGRIAALRSKMDALKDVKVPTQEYGEISNQIEKAQLKLNRLIERQEQFAASGKTSGSSWDTLQRNIESTTKEIEYAKGELQDLVDTGKAFTMGAKSEQYEKWKLDARDLENTLNALVQKQQELSGITREMSDAEYMRQAEENIDRIIARMEEVRQKESETPVESWLPRNDEAIGVDSIRRAQQELQNLIDASSNARAQAVVSDQELVDLLERRKELLAEIKDLEKAGVTEGYADFDSRIQELEEINDLIAQHRELGTEITNADRKAYLFAQGQKIVASAIDRTKSTLKKLGNISKKVFSSMGKSSKGTSNVFKSGLKTILKYGLGIRSLYVLINKLRTAIKEGFKNLYDDKNIAGYKNSVDSLKASMLTLKNAFAAAFRPLVETAIPYIRQTIEYMTTLLDIIGQFMAAITGQTKYTRAVRQTADAIDEANKASNRQLSSLDKLNNLTTANGSGTGSGNMFEEVPLSDGWKNIAERLKQMWNDADFTELGAELGKKLKEALDNIPWNKIKESARKMAKRLATLINGFIETEGLGYSIGRTLAEAVNTGFEYLDSFVDELHWGSIGRFIADALNGGLENIDWELIRDTFVAGAKGLADLINNFNNWFHWDNISDTISNAVNTVAETVYTFFSTVNWDELGHNMGEQLRKSIEKIDWEEVGRALGSIVQAALDFLISFIEEQDMSVIAQAVVDTLKGFFEVVDKGDLAKAILTIIAAKLAVKGVKFGFKKAAEAILSGLSGTFARGLGGFHTISNSITNGIQTAVSSAGSTAGMTGIGTTIGIGIIGGITAAIGGWNLGQWLYEQISGEQITMSFSEQMSEIGKSFTDGSWKEALKLWKDDLSEAGKSFTDGSWKDAFRLWKDDIVEYISETSPLLKSLKKDQDDCTDSTGGMMAACSEMVDAVTAGADTLKNVVTADNDAMGISNDALEKNFSGNAEKIADSISDVASRLDSNKDSFSTWAETVKRMLEGVRGAFEKLGSAASGALSGIKSAQSTSSAYSARSMPQLAALSAMDIPAYATGQVIPRTMQQHLAILGDNKRETEVVSPLSTIEQAVENVMGRSNGGEQTINLHLTVECEGYQLVNLIQKLDGEYLKQTKRHILT